MSPCRWGHQGTAVAQLRHPQSVLNGPKKLHLGFGELLKISWGGLQYGALAKWAGRWERSHHRRHNIDTSLNACPCGMCLGTECKGNALTPVLRKAAAVHPPGMPALSPPLAAPRWSALGFFSIVARTHDELRSVIGHALTDSLSVMALRPPWAAACLLCMRILLVSAGSANLFGPTPSQPLCSPLDRDPLQTWLSSTKIRIPPISFSVELPPLQEKSAAIVHVCETTALTVLLIAGSDDAQATLSNVTCDSLMLRRIKSSRGSETNAITTLRLGLDGFSMRCAGLWAYQITFPQKQGSGSFTFAVNHTSLDMNLLFSGAPGLPWLSFEGPGDFGGCNVDCRVTELRVTGAGILSNLISLFQSHIETAIRSKLNVVACQNGRAALASVSTLLAPYQPYRPFRQQPARVHIPGDPSTLLEWREVGLLRAIPNATRMGRIANAIVLDTLGRTGIANASLSGIDLALPQVLCVCVFVCV